MDVLSDKVSRTLLTALRGLALRQATIAGNIANIDTPGFKASEVTFEDQLQRVIHQREDRPMPMTGSRDKHLSFGDDSFMEVTPQIRPVSSSFRNDGNSVDIDKEMVTLADTAIRYQGVARLLTERLAYLRNIAYEGRR